MSRMLKIPINVLNKNKLTFLTFDIFKIQMMSLIFIINMNKAF